ncbi:uncharacterized protein PV07_09275 [Cladophialophora immunda]|uniref:Uncharacterized protein n=1 Tax=Cladophialophora immunda TaxID=569365 RepID=A0A0D2C4Q6_9EURO|nr:uncharacterized protein PV07_09275 [Cladophialophora immunda]KIW26158.1 hypothetical protein PV07_09275 [Cladophialophora immunda]
MLPIRPPGRKPMTMAEKILATHDTERRGEVQLGDTLRIDVDWVIASELSWKGMERTYDLMGKPGIFRNDRFWLAGDHRVHPRLTQEPQIKALMDASVRAKKDFKMTEFQGFNYTILHTEFFRERAQPGMLVIGSDSHTCSAGAIGCLAIGLGGADVTVPLITGETWIKVPEIVNLRFINRPPRGIGGKDTILYILKEFKRNTIAADRIVEFTGPGLKYLSLDARFAIANMTTELGGVTGIFEADQRTFDFVNRRHMKRYKNDSNYFRADLDANYCKIFEIDLAKVEAFVARFPSPDNVVPIQDIAGMKLEGCFIGACTTAEEDLIIGAMVLEEGMKQGMVPVKGRRLVIPGSRPIRHKLDKLGFTEIYQAAGFEVGVPGCSMCVGTGVDRAGEGEMWLSSQNRNFKNRMGKGSVANLASAATVAASSFKMEVTNPQYLLERLDEARLTQYLGYDPLIDRIPVSIGSPSFMEPGGSSTATTHEIAGPIVRKSTAMKTARPSDEAKPSTIISGKVFKLGDFIDTDAIAPSQFAMSSKTQADFGLHCMELFMPEFRQLVKDGLNVIVAGESFGCGSSREAAVTCLLGAGIHCVIAKSFSFIYARNQPNLGLLGFTITDKDFHELAQQGAEININLSAREVMIQGKRFPFKLSEMEKQLIAVGGITSAFQEFGKRLFERMCSGQPTVARQRPQDERRELF